MTGINELMSSFYNVLLQIRYPKITKAEPRDIASVIFTGKNRIHLLSWLITEKSLQAANVIGKLQNNVLEEELVKYYSQLGICTSKDTLLGNCPLEEQISTLKLLLEFIMNTHINSDNIENVLDESIEQISTLYFDKTTDQLSILNNILPKSSYNDVRKDFENLKSVNLSSDCILPVSPSMEKLTLSISDEPDQNSTEHKESFTSYVDNFVSVFESVVHWPISAKNIGRNYIDTDIKNLHFNFAAVKKIAHLTDLISTLAIPDEIGQTCTPLGSIIENIATCTEKDIFSMQ